MASGLVSSKFFYYSQDTYKSTYHTIQDIRQWESVDGHEAPLSSGHFDCLFGPCPTDSMTNGLMQPIDNNENASTTNPVGVPSTSKNK